MSSSTSLLLKLAEEISRNTSVIVEHLNRNDLPQPSFDADGPSHPIPEANEELSAARHALIEASKALHTLAVGPSETTRLFYFKDIYFVGAMQVLCHFNVPQQVPVHGEISMGELSTKTGLDKGLLARFLRMAAVNYYFTEPRPEFIAHTAWSKTLATDPKMRACVWFRHSEMMPSVAKLVEAVETYTSSPEAAEPRNTAFRLAFGDTFFDYKEKHQDHMVKFGQFVDAFASGIEADTAESFARAYTWETLPAGSLVVDVGGGIGHISTAVAQKHPLLRFQVQDFGDLAEESSLLRQSAGVSDRVQFCPHNFFDPQPETSREAAVYFLRNIMHNWPDMDCRRILKPIVEVMSPDSRLVVCDIVLPEPNTTPKTQEAQVRALDIVMLSMFNAKERSYEDWQDLFTSVDSRLRITAVIGRPKLGTESLIEARLMQ
ncbi:O-methyltransferase-domain-containing protein [Chaetomium fimeti]|uniref:O-methyltransferase-domain-containing protein n=1 Tax=Chaetomium fimeti TaxID=1854472 RepID=A0AAE0LT47_9PEZI|nr:O-methyltransferase-domain-containing protein [Chaetomium fimeti]